MFPHGLVYKNSADDGSDYSVNARGETGAQDSCIPACDTILQLSYPKNKLTQYLYELREYRPIDVQNYLS